MRNLLFILLLPSLFATCKGLKGHHSSSASPLCFDSIPQDVYIDSVSSDDGNLKIYNWAARGMGNVREYYGAMTYRTKQGKVYAEMRSVLDIATQGSCILHLPVENIYQDQGEEGTIYLIQLDNLESSAHDNTLLVALRIQGDSLVPISIFRDESRDTCIMATHF